MPATEALKTIACARIDERREEIIGIARDILAHPETGFTEERTSRLVRQTFDRLGVPHRDGMALTGVKGHIACRGGPGPRVAVIGELDSLRVVEHPYADPVTGAAHACGHHAQIAMMLGATIGLIAPEVLGSLSGAIVPFAVPAEEFIEVERRIRLRAQGKIEFMGGKQELIRLGEFDDVAMAMMCHTTSASHERNFALGGTSNGHIVKYVQFTGRGAHAGGAPHLGINALNAAMLALNAINANRETMRNEDIVRVHGIITQGGDAVSAVPADVRLEWRVRASSPEVVARESAKVDRCFKAGALAVGARVKITNIPGYLPLRNDPTLLEVFKANAEALVGKSNVVTRRDRQTRGGSTDMGDLSHVLPVVHPYVGGARGTGHGKNYLIEDFDLAVINPAKCMAMTVIDLLAEGARRAKEVVAESTLPMTREQYVQLQRQQAQVIEYDGARP